MATPFMGLLLPTPGVTQGLGIAAPGQSWLELINSAFDAIDSHNHATGKGSPIDGAGIGITADFSFNAFNVFGLRSARFNNQGAPLGLTSDLNCLYVSGGNLYFNDGVGNQIRLTLAGSIGGTPGSISGLTAPASASYLGGTFSWLSNTATYAYFGVGPITTYNPVSGGFGVQIKAPASISSTYAMTLPAALPAGQRIMTLDNAGLVAAAWNPDGTTITVASNTLGIPNGGVGTAQLAPGAVTNAKRAALGQQVSTSSGNYSTGSTIYTDVTNLTVTLTTTGRPVQIMLVPDGGTIVGYLGVAAGAAGGNATFKLLRDAVTVGITELLAAANDTITIPGAVFFDAPAAGTYVYKLQTLVNVGTVLSSPSYLKLVAFEL